MPWPTKKLGEVLEYEQPTNYLVSSTEYKDKFPTPVLTAGKSFILGNTNEKNGIFSEEKLPVIIFDDFTTAIKFVDFPFKVKSSAMKILHAKKNVADIKFLFYKMQTIKFEHNQHKRYWISEYSNIEIPLPPIGEQRKIVGKMEKLFAKIDEASRLRAESSTASAALLPSALHQVFSRAEKEGWEEKELGDICEILDSQRKPVTKRDRKPGPYSYYGATGVQDYVADFIFDEPLVLVGEDGAKWGAGEGTAYRVEGKCWVNNHAHVLRPHRDKVLDGWLTNFINISDLSEYITGLTVKKLNQKKLKSIKIPLPSVAEQKKIVADLDLLSQKARELQNLQSQTAADFSALRQSVLSRAFSGTL